MFVKAAHPNEFVCHFTHVYPCSETIKMKRRIGGETPTHVLWLADNAEEQTKAHKELYNMAK